MRREGRDEGIQNINRLNGYLLADKRYSDLERSTKDTEYQEKLLKEYGREYNKIPVSDVRRKCKLLSPDI